MDIYYIIWLLGIPFSFLYLTRRWNVDWCKDGVDRFIRGAGIILVSVFWPVGWSMIFVVFFIIKIGNYQRK